MDDLFDTSGLYVPTAVSHCIHTQYSITLSNVSSTMVTCPLQEERLGDDYGEQTFSTDVRFMPRVNYSKTVIFVSLKICRYSGLQ